MPSPIDSRVRAALSSYESELREERVAEIERYMHDFFAATGVSEMRMVIFCDALHPSERMQEVEEIVDTLVNRWNGEFGFSLRTGMSPIDGSVELVIYDRRPRGAR